jgi:hypothetical protein
VRRFNLWRLAEEMRADLWVAVPVVIRFRNRGAAASVQSREDEPFLSVVADP